MTERGKDLMTRGRCSPTGTRLHLHREKTRIEAVSSAVIAASSGKKLGINMTNQIKKRVHAAKVRAADKTTLIVHPNVRQRLIWWRGRDRFQDDQIVKKD